MSEIFQIKNPVILIGKIIEYTVTQLIELRKTKNNIVYMYNIFIN